MSSPRTPSSGRPDLDGPPRNGSIYFLGNSMFGTGLDLDQVRRALPQENSIFGYYNGSYTSMWYAAIRNGLIPSGIRPRIVVWGFRPTYADRPAFRQNKPMALESYLDRNDRVFASILHYAGDPSYRVIGVTAGPPVDRQSVMEWLAGIFPVIGHRTDWRDGLMKKSAALTARIFAGQSDSARAYLASRGQLKVSDLVVFRATGGTIKRADALIVDNGARFVTGRPVPFNRSFVPRIVQLLRSAGIPQLVVIFRPVSVLDGNMPADAIDFHRDAVEYLRSNQVPCLDFVPDDHLTREFYARGDHYTARGMAYVTERIIEALKSGALPLAPPGGRHG